MATTTSSQYGDCYLAVHARFIGAQPVRVQGITAAGSANGRKHVQVVFGRIAFYLEDREAFDSFRDAFLQAQARAEQIFVPTRDAFEDAQRRADEYIARHGRPGGGG